MQQARSIGAHTIVMTSKHYSVRDQNWLSAMLPDLQNSLVDLDSYPQWDSRRPLCVKLQGQSRFTMGLFSTYNDSALRRNLVL